MKVHDVYGLIGLLLASGGMYGLWGWPVTLLVDGCLLVIIALLIAPGHGDR